VPKEKSTMAIFVYQHLACTFFKHLQLRITMILPLLTGITNHL
jgi:hypothetical protein